MTTSSQSQQQQQQGRGAVVVEARGLVKTFSSGGGKVEVLHGVDLAVRAGESVAIRGESGSGKTTLLNLLAGLESPEAGQVLWDGAALGALPAAEVARRRARWLGMVFQAYVLVPELDARENVLLAARIAGRADAAARARTDDLVARVGLAGRARGMPSELSGGERQRVAVARALLNRPRLVLADEPTGNLDEATGAGVMDLLLELCRAEGAALILVTHNPAHAARCDRAVHLKAGRLG